MDPVIKIIYAAFQGPSPGCLSQLPTYRFKENSSWNSHPKLRKGDYKTYLDDLVLLPNLKSLRICFIGLDKGQLLQLVRQAISLNMHTLSVPKYSFDCTSFSYCKGVEENLSHEP